MLFGGPPVPNVRSERAGQPVNHDDLRASIESIVTRIARVCKNLQRLDTISVGPHAGVQEALLAAQSCCWQASMQSTACQHRRACTCDITNLYMRHNEHVHGGAAALIV